MLLKLDAALVLDPDIIPAHQSAAQVNEHQLVSVGGVAIAQCSLTDSEDLG